MTARSMKQTFPGFRIHETDRGVRAGLESIRLDDLTDGDVVVQVEYSSINYKDALAATGKGAILKRFPLVGGIDLAGQVVESAVPSLTAGTAVVVCGCGLSETHDGGYAAYARVPADFVVPLPTGLDTRSAMAIGTAGLTAALAVERLENNGQSPDLGPILVTGATGGVGSLAVDMLEARGYSVVALTAKRDRHDYLRALGADSVLDAKDFRFGDKPLERASFGGGVDSLGGEALSGLLRSTRPGGAVASIGLAASAKLETTVLPFILRGVSLLGIDSVHVPAERRAAIWQRLAADLRPRHLDLIVTREVTLDDLADCFGAYIDGSVVGRSVVKIG